MPSLYYVFWDQLSHCLFTDVQKDDLIFFCETRKEATFVKHHPQKLAFLFASMRHFAKELEEKGHNVIYHKLTDKNNSGDLKKEIVKILEKFDISQLVVVQPSKYQDKMMLESLADLLKICVKIQEDIRFLSTQEDFQSFAKGKKQLRMEYFYRAMRKKHNILLDNQKEPVGGKWNYDKENREPAKEDLRFKKRLTHKKSTILTEVLEMVSENFSDHFGDLENFHYAVTRKQALLELDYFIKEILPDFGKTQDMMLENEPFLNHAMLSAYLNAGLLLPLEVCKAAEEEYHAKRASLASVEGFIRQILGWREYIRGIYWLKMPKYADLNTLSAKTPLPDFYWGSETKMHCVAKAVADTQKYAYSHHIQRLMVTGNFALLAGLDVKQVQEWYLSVYIDAHEWVEMPNTLGMALFGDGGIVASKPYAASGKYIYRMSNFCQNCAYCPKQLLEDTACPFNALYWDFLVRHRKIFEKNPRLFYAYNTFDKFEKSKQKAIGEKAKKILTAMRDEKL